MKIFLSHSSKDEDIAEKVFLALLESGHEVFYDRDRLQAGRSFHEKIESELNSCDLFIFLISPNSVKPSSYTLTEVKYAQKKWKHPKNHVLPVMVEDTSFEEIPNYLAAVTIFTTVGNIPAEVASEVNCINNNNNNSQPQNKLIIVLPLLVAMIAWAFYYANPNQNQQPSSPIEVPNTRISNGNTNDTCINQYDNISFIELGSKDIRVESKLQKATLVLRENNKQIALVLLNALADNKMFKIDSVIDSSCEKISTYFNHSVGGDKQTLNDWETLGLSTDGNTYFLRLGYVDGLIEINKFYKKQ